MNNILSKLLFLLLILTSLTAKTSIFHASNNQADFIVPSQLNLLFENDKTNTLSELTIENKMNTPLIIESINVTQLSDWQLTLDEATFTPNNKKIEFLIDNQVLKLGINKLNCSIEDKKTFEINVKHSFFTYDIPSTDAFQFDIIYQIEKSEFNLTLIDSTQTSTMTLLNGEPFLLPEIKKEGYQLEGWKDKDNNILYPALSTFIMPSNDITLYTSFIPISYTLEYELDGGLFLSDPPTSYTIESSLSIPPPSKEGYIFEGWEMNQQLFPTYNISAGSTGNLKLIAKYRLPKITLLDSLDQQYKDEIYTNQSANLPLPTKENYEFDGWYIATQKSTIPLLTFTQLTSNYPWINTNDVWSSGNKGVNSSTSNMISEAFTLDSTETLSFDWRSNGEASFDYLGYDIYNVESGKYLSSKTSPSYKSCLKTLKAKASTTFTTETIQLEPGHYQLLFMYGKDASTSKNEDQGFVKNIFYSCPTYYTYSSQICPLNFNEDCILISKWRPKSYTYTINHQSSTGKELLIETVNYPYNSTIELLPKTFDGYISPISKNVLLQDFNEKINMIYTPQVYQISYNLNGGTLPNDAITTYTIENSIFYLPIPTKENYKFKGWYNNSSLTGNKVESIDPFLKQNLVLYAAWEKLPTYILTYGTSVRTQIPDEATNVVFTDITAPQGSTLVDLSQAKDMSVVGWLNNDTYYISTQTPNQKVIANENSSQMFYNKQNIKSIIFANLDTSRVKNMSRFLMKTTLNSIDLSSLDTSSVEDMQYMFRECTLLTNLNINNFNTSNVKNMQHMFYGCSNLTTLDLSTWKTPNLENTVNMFAVCENLKNIYLTNFETSKVLDMNNMFYLCRKLVELDLSSFTITKDTNTYAMFSQTNQLKKVTFGANWRFNNSELFTQHSTWMPGADGKWYNSQGIGYTASELSIAFDNNPTAMRGTYYAIKP